MTMGSGLWTFNLSAWFSSCDKYQNDTDFLFHRETIGSQDLVNVTVLKVLHQTQFLG